MRLPTPTRSQVTGCPTVEPSTGGLRIGNGGTWTRLPILAPPFLPSPLLNSGYVTVTVVGSSSTKGGIHLAADLKLECVWRNPSSCVNALLKRAPKKLAELKVKWIVSLAVILSMKVSAYGNRDQQEQGKATYLFLDHDVVCGDHTDDHESLVLPIPLELVAAFTLGCHLN